MVASATATTKAQIHLSAKLNVSSLENRWRIEADNRFFWTSQPTYGLGTATPEDAKLDMKFNHFRIVDRYYKQVRRNVFLGAGYVYNIHNNVRPPDEVDPEVFAESPYITYSEQFGFDLDSQTSAGFSLHALVDSRDGAINPSRGWFANASYLILIDDFLGGDSTWQQFSYDLRTYARLSRDGRHKLAFWTFGDLVTGGVAPYLDLPSTGGDTYARSGRGYPQGRFRGEEMLYAEAEYRWSITDNGLFGMVAFVNAQTLSNDQADERLFDSVAPGGGFGFRFMLNKRSKTNLCMDIGFGEQGLQGRVLRRTGGVLRRTPMARARPTRRRTVGFILLATAAAAAAWLWGRRRGGRAAGRVHSSRDRSRTSRRRSRALPGLARRPPAWCGSPAASSRWAPGIRAT